MPKEKPAAQEKLRGLGPKSLASLHNIGIFSKADLAKRGAIETFLLLQEQADTLKPSLNFLYALVGALEDRDWRDVAKNDKTRLITELEAAREFRAIQAD